MIKEILIESNESDMLKNVNAILKAGDSVETNIKNITKIDKKAGARLTKHFDAVMDVNLRGAYFLTQAVASGLLAAGRPGSPAEPRASRPRCAGARRDGRPRTRAPPT